MHWFDRFRIYWYHRKQSKRWPDDGARSLGWTDRDSQHARFSVIANSVEFDGQTVLDLGCGYGDLYPFLTAQYSIPSYLGVEQHATFYQQAKARHQNPMCAFTRGDISTMPLNSHDVVVASGSLNYASKNEHYLTSMITRMYGLANKTLVFNLLDKHYYPARQLLVSYHPQGVYRFCKTLCEDVTLIDGYCDGDFTIVMNKRKSQ
jgi:ubiquinone/menaquinone biosynthesis C-methylase UbiE